MVGRVPSLRWGGASNQGASISQALRPHRHAGAQAGSVVQCGRLWESQSLPPPNLLGLEQLPGTGLLQAWGPAVLQDPATPPGVRWWAQGGRGPGSESPQGGRGTSQGPMAPAPLTSNTLMARVSGGLGGPQGKQQRQHRLPSPLHQAARLCGLRDEAQPLPSPAPLRASWIRLCRLPTSGDCGEACQLPPPSACPQPGPGSSTAPPGRSGAGGLCAHLTSSGTGGGGSGAVGAAPGPEDTASGGLG